MRIPANITKMKSLIIVNGVVVKDKPLGALKKIHCIEIASDANNVARKSDRPGGEAHAAIKYEYNP